MDVKTVLLKLVNRLFFRRSRENRCIDKLRGCVAGKMTDNFLQLLLKAMSLMFCINPDYRRNIDGFEAKYVFADRNTHIYVVAIFRKNKLIVRKRPVLSHTFRLVFKDGASLIELLFAKSFNILDAVLRQEIDFEGNINYISKFAYMAYAVQNNVLKMK
jgi:hypothetical protein